MSHEAAADLLSWEDLGAQPSGRAFRRSLAELLRHPAAFYRKMALTGGLHEPVAFFAVALGAVVVLAFPAALAYYLLMRPDPARMAPEVYARYVLVTQGTGVALVLLPVALAVGAGAMVLLGTVFHLAGKPFGTRNWEGSVSVWLYAGAGALVPLAAALVLLLLVSLAGCLLGVPAVAAHWTLLGGVGAGARGRRVAAVRAERGRLRGGVRAGARARRGGGARGGGGGGGGGLRRWAGHRLARRGLRVRTGRPGAWPRCGGEATEPWSTSPSSRGAS